MSTIERSSSDAENRHDQHETTPRTNLALTYDDDAGTATVSSAPPDELTVPATEWITVDQSTLVDVREHS